MEWAMDAFVIPVWTGANFRNLYLSFPRTRESTAAIMRRRTDTGLKARIANYMRDDRGYPAK